MGRMGQITRMRAPLAAAVIGLLIVGLAARVELGERRLDREVPGAARGEVLDRLALEQNRLARELTHTLQLILLDRLGRISGDFDRLGHEKFSERSRSHERRLGAL